MVERVGSARERSERGSGRVRGQSLPVRVYRTKHRVVGSWNSMQVELGGLVCGGLECGDVGVWECSNLQVASLNVASVSGS